MAQPSKIVTAATQVLNKFAPRADRCIACLPLTETSEPGGTGFANIGHGTTYGGAYTYANGTTIAAGTGALTFGSDGLRTTYAQTLAGTTDRAAIRALVNGDATSDIYANGSILVDFKDPGATPGAGTKRYFVSTGAASTTVAGTLLVYRDENDNLKIDVGAGVVVDSITFSSSEITWANWQTLLLCWHNGTLTAYLNRTSTTATANGGSKSVALTGGFVAIIGSRYLNLGGFNQSASGVTYTARFSILAMWDVALDKSPWDTQTLYYVNQILSDPWLIVRPAPSIEDEWSTAVSALVSRVTATTANFNMVTGLGDTGDVSGELTFTTGLNWRVLVGTSNDPTSASHCNSTSTGTAVTDTFDIITASNIALTGLSANTKYYLRAEYTNDNGSTWLPFPGGLQTFRTKRTAVVAGGWNVGMVSDHHLCNDVDIWDMSDLANICYGVVNYNTGASRKALALEKAIHALVLLQECDFFVDGGDYLMSDTAHFSKVTYPSIDDRNDLLFYDCAVRAAHERNFCHMLYSAGAHNKQDGNHETRGGYSQNGDRNTTTGANFNSAAYQAVSTNIIKTYWPMPTDGEDEGDPSSDNTLSWLAPDEGIVNTYSGGRAQYLSDYVTGPHANPRGLNKSPLEIYYRFKWGADEQEALFIITHATFYTSPGDTDQATDILQNSGFRFRALGSFTRGARQEAWLDAVYEENKAVPNKFEFAHHHTGGVHVGDGGDLSAFFADYGYGRNTGMTETGPEHQRDYARARKYGRNAKFTSHDHKFCHAVKPGSTVNEINLGTAGAPSHSGGGSGTLGWHNSQQEVNSGFGTAESDGADLEAIGDGRGTTLGNKKMLNVMGVCVLNIGGSAHPTLKFIRTEIARGDDGAALNQTPSHLERNLGALKTTASDVATLDDTPREVVDAYLAADIIRDRDDPDPFWSTVPTSKKGSAVGQYPYDEDRNSAAVTLDASVDNADVYVMAVPMVMYEVELSPASARGSGLGNDLRYAGARDTRNLGTTSRDLRDEDMVLGRDVRGLELLDA